MSHTEKQIEQIISLALSYTNNARDIFVLGKLKCTIVNSVVVISYSKRWLNERLELSINEIEDRKLFKLYLIDKIVDLYYRFEWRGDESVEDIAKLVNISPKIIIDKAHLLQDVVIDKIEELMIYIEKEEIVSTGFAKMLRVFKSL